MQIMISYARVYSHGAGAEGLACVFSKNERAWAFLLFSRSPHLKQEDVGKMLQFLNIRGTLYKRLLKKAFSGQKADGYI